LVDDDNLASFPNSCSFPQCCPHVCSSLNFSLPNYSEFPQHLLDNSLSQFPHSIPRFPDPATGDFNFLHAPTTEPVPFNSESWFFAPGHRHDVQCPTWDQSCNWNSSHTATEPMLYSTDTMLGDSLGQLFDIGFPMFELGMNNRAQTFQPTQPLLSEATESQNRKRNADYLSSEPNQASNLFQPVGDYVCGWRGCQDRFDQMVQFRHHVRSHTLEETKCLWSGCRRQPEAPSSLNKHLDTHVKPYHCTFAGCFHRAAKQRDMRRHMTSHTLSEGSTVYYCPSPNCTHSEGGKPFTRADNARRHMSTMHAGLMLPLVIQIHRE
jgi:hypothetical protein